MQANGETHTIYMKRHVGNPSNLLLVKYCSKQIIMHFSFSVSVALGQVVIQRSCLKIGYALII